MSVWIEVGIACFCFLFLGTGDETYLSLYATGVFVLFSMTGWAAAKRPLRLHRNNFTPLLALGLLGTILAALRDQNLNARAITTGSGPARTIVELADSENADLIVLSKSGRGASHHHAPIGSVASRVLQLTRRPVLLIDSADTSTHKFS
jgi:hypothetical protein